MNYYNENDPKAAAWLRELIAGGHVPAGVVDERSITEILPDELSEYTQCHFFAGIGGWSLALQLAGWPESKPVWTGSCPCQPFSSAGKRMGRKDPRHLWPAFRRLINQCSPPVVFGEQVASKNGRAWLSGVFANLETMGYAGAGADLCAAGVGAPQIRQRLYWVAYATGERWKWSKLGRDKTGRRFAANGGIAGRVDNTGGERWGTWGAGDYGADDRQQFDAANAAGRVADANSLDGDRAGHGASYDGGQQRGAGTIQGQHDICGLADAAGVSRAQQFDESWEGSRRAAAAVDTAECSGSCGVGNADGGRCEDAVQQCRNGQEEAGDGKTSIFGGGGAWDCFDVLPCTDGKARRIESGTFPLAHGVPGRVGLLRGYGNAIVPEVAETFIRACEEVIPKIVRDFDIV